MPLLHIGGYEWLDWHLHPEVVVPLLLLQGLYLYVVTELRPLVSDAARVKRSQMALFSLAVLVMYLATGWPLHALAEDYLASAHMLQHLLLTMVAAPLLLAGTPVWVWQALLRPRLALAAGRLITHPGVALVGFNLVLLLTHLPGSVQLQLEQPWFHLLVHISLVAAGLLLWWPVLSAVPELPALSYPLQMGYLFLQSLLPAVMASFVTFSDGVVYHVYENAPRVWGISPVEDQRMAGGLMKLLGSLILWTFIALAFFRWYEREEAEARGLPWRDVEAELDRLGLRPKK
ncbi:MAG TPA: cytochrome c oxidase assembly protein [Dehalococcoidia bacterium]|nr:cytochrome c oxidase assembly protein [Dehalococcoidia bacterium]